MPPRLQTSGEDHPHQLPRSGLLRRVRIDRRDYPVFVEVVDEILEALDCRAGVKPTLSVRPKRGFEEVPRGASFDLGECSYRPSLVVKASTEWQVLIEIIAKVTLAGESADQPHRNAVALTCVGEFAREQELGKFRNKARATGQPNKPRGSEATSPLALFEEQSKLGV